MSAPSDPTASVSDDNRAWFCLKTRPKQEHIGAFHLRQNPRIELFNPRIRFKRATKKGPTTVTESLFPGYLFACFHWPADLPFVRSRSGISGVVHFGDHYPRLPEETIHQLIELVGSQSVLVLPTQLQPGDLVKINRGSLQGLAAVVTEVLPSGERVKALLNFLGRQTSLEIPVADVTPKMRHPLSEPPRERTRLAG